MTEKQSDSTIESVETPRQELLRLIRESGFENELTQSKFRDWLLSVSRSIPQSKEKFQALLEVDRECARLYFEADLKKEALYIFEIVLFYAVKERHIELYESINAEMKYLGLK